MPKPTRETLNKWLPQSGPCLVCSDPSYQQRHRIVDAIRDRYHGGESIRSLAEDFGLSREVTTYIARARMQELDWLRRYRRKDAAERLQRELQSLAAFIDAPLEGRKA